MRVVTILTLSAGTLLAACGGSSGPTGPSGPPAVIVVNGATLPSGTIGATVVIEGSNFGASASAASGHVVFSTTAGGRDTAVIASAADWTNLLIVTTVPTGVPVGKDTLFVETSGGTSTPIVFSVVARVAFSPSGKLDRHDGVARRAERSRGRRGHAPGGRFHERRLRRRRRRQQQHPA